MIAVGEVLDVPGELRPARGAPALPIDVARTIEELLSSVPLDFVHVHEPFAPSTSNAALRHSRALNVGSFHAPTERLLSTLMARRFVETFFGRLDARTASLPETAELMDAALPRRLPPRLARRSGDPRAGSVGAQVRADGDWEGRSTARSTRAGGAPA